MISVCIATYNGEKYIKEQLQSVLSQLSENDEVIISDDCSTDHTLEIIKDMEDYRIKIFEGKRFASPILNFENALFHSKGDYIFLCDQDDVWLPSKVKNTLPYLLEYDLVVSDCKIVDKDLNVIHFSFQEGLSSGKGFWKNLIKNTYLGCCMAFRKEVLNYALPFPKGIAMHDIWIGLSVELNGHPFFLKESFLLYRRHGNNASFASEKSRFSLVFKVKYRLHMLYNLVNRKLKKK